MTAHPGRAFARATPPTVPSGKPVRRHTPPASGNLAWQQVPRSGFSDRWQCIVIHHSAGPTGGAVAFDRMHRLPPRNWDELGYHFVIGNGTDTGDGEIEVGSRWFKQKHGAHCKTPGNYHNLHGIGICLVGNFEHTAPTPSQMDSLTCLVRFLVEKHNIPVSRVYTHCEVTRATLCPGKYFDADALRKRVASSALATSH